MTILFRRRAHDGTPASDADTAFAVPLLPASATLMINALRGVETLHRQTNPHLAGHQRVADHLANVVLTDAGTASALGHDTVPLLIKHLTHVDSAVREAERLAPGHDATMQFRLLRDKLTALAGTARVYGWVVVVHHGTATGGWLPTCTWAAGCPAAQHTAMPRLVAALERGA